VLDEVGLAEASPYLPLKALHPLLEDGIEGSSSDDRRLSREERVAFIGISNWALDPAKMNRGIMVTRCPPIAEELIKSANGIANIVKNDFLRSELTKSFDALATMYNNICSKQEDYKNNIANADEVREFFGLRDFYTMIKMLCWKCIETENVPSPENYRSIILRNFSGHHAINPLDELPNPAALISMISKEGEELELIKECLEPLRLNNTKAPEVELPKQENRYLLFITENQSALQIIQSELLKQETPFVCYGSSFPKDTEYTQVCVNINKIKVYMEKGYPVILLNYEQIYESLYDVLNQCYTELPTGRYVDLGLRSYRIKCRVHPNFRLIIIAEKSRVFTQFPTALINRLEKHYLAYRTILSNKQKEQVNILQKWIDQFSTIEHNQKKFTSKDAFIGYQDDTASSVILYLHQIQKETLKDIECTEKEENDADNRQVLEQAFAILLQTATIDSLARLKVKSSICDGEIKDLAFNTYFEIQNHCSLMEFLNNCDEQIRKGSYIQITTFGSLLSRKYAPELAFGLNLEEENIKILQLSDFESEMDFSSQIREIFEADTGGSMKLLIVQCSYNETINDLLACARHRLIDEKNRPQSNGITAVIFIVQLMRISGGTSFTSFQGKPWTCTHIDQLICGEGVNNIVKLAVSEPLHKFFHILIEKGDEVPSDFKICTRLKDCVQIAVSRITSAQTYQQMERVIDILFDAISDHVSINEVTYLDTFTGCLLARMESLLQQKDENNFNPNNWAVEASLDRHKLQTSFTLINCIKKLLDVEIQRILAYILSCTDKYHNLNLLQSENKLTKKLWLQLFSSSLFLQFDYNSIILSADTSTNIKGQSYECRFPFSWELIDQLNATFVRIIHSNSELQKNDKQKLFESSVEAATALAFYKDISVPPEHSFDLYKNYLHDFLRNLYLPFSDVCIEDVYQILEKVVTEIVVVFEPAAISNVTPFPIINAIVGVHVAYNLMEKEIFWLAELCEGSPELPSRLKSKALLSSGQIIFHFEAVHCIVDDLSPPIKMDWNEESLKKWLLKFHSNKSAVESILHLESNDDNSQKLLTISRSKWQKVIALVLLSENVIALLPLYLNNKKFSFLKRYNNAIKSLNFSEPKILKQSILLIQSILMSLPAKEQPCCELCKSNLPMKAIVYVPCDKCHMFCKLCFQSSLESRGPRCPCCDTPIPRQKEFPIPEKKLKEYEELKKVQQHCLDFFIELVSRCCFSNVAPEKPSDEFFEKLLNIVTDPENEDYKHLFPYEEEHVNSCPIAHSVLLEFLLKYNPEQVKQKLQEYQKYMIEHFGSEYTVEDHELTLLFIKSTEDGLCKNLILKSSLDDKINYGIDCLNDALVLLTNGDILNTHLQNKSVKFMQCIANVRFGFCFATDIFHNFYCTPDARNNLPRVTKENLANLIEKVKEVVEKGVLKEPRDFIIKQIVRKYGKIYLDILSELPEFDWLGIKPKEIDVFVISGVDYTTHRSEWPKIKMNIEDHLQTSFKKSNVSQKKALMLAFYKVVSSQVTNAGDEKLSYFRRQIHALQNISELDFYKIHSENDSLIEPIFTPIEDKIKKSLSEVVVHFISVVGAVLSKEIFTPFVTIMTKTAKAQNMYWPTMPDNILDIVIEATKGTRDTWWKCPNGHDYFVQNCGRPVVGEVRKCFCGAPIGGTDYNVASENNRMVSDEQLVGSLTKCGHCLEPIKSRSTNPTPERNMSPTSNCILKILIHSVCIWVACSNNKTMCDELAECVSHDPPVPADELLDFFWHHLEVDFQTLQRATQHSSDDCIYLIHSLIHNILSVKCENKIDDVFLQSRKARENWEVLFDSVYIIPFMENIENHIEKARQSVMEDSDRDYRAILQMIYERSTNSSSITPHLWIYRPQITIDHVTMSLQNTTVHADLKVLKEFLQKVNLLSALQYLPEIVQLQNYLYETCHHRIDSKDAEKPIEQFISEHVKVHQKKRVLQWVEKFCLAWNKVKTDLPTLMCVTVPNEYINVTMSLEQPLEFFLPMKEGKGVCSVALLSYLARLQNDFIDLAWEKLKLMEHHGKHNVPLQKIQHCQMISFENQLSQVIFSHCKYSLKAGHGDDVTYDFVALEKHILDRFVRGKPLITFDILLMSYRSDVLEAQIFKNIRYITQESLPQNDKDIILREINKKQCLQDNIDNLNIALGFLQYNKWEPHLLMKRYLSNLKMEGKLATSIEERCEICHAISLWRTLNVEQAKTIINGGEDPFPGINPVFKVALDQRQTDLLRVALGSYDMNQFLEVFYEFIVTQVKSRKEYEAEDSLIDAYEDVCDYFGLDVIKGFADNFPKEFSLEHVTEIWKEAAKYQQDQLAKLQ
jgi:hypothetical protein